MERKNAMYQMGSNGGKSMPPPSTHAQGNLSNLLQMHPSSSKERFKVIDQGNSTQGAGNITDMIQKAKLGGASPDFGTMSSKEGVSVDQQQEEATL